MSMSVEQIRSNIQDQLADLDRDRERLQVALDALSGETEVDFEPVDPPTVVPLKAAGKPKSKTTKRYTDEQIIQAVQDLGPEPAPAGKVRENLPGMTSHTLSMRFRRLLDRGALERTGERRESAYTVAAA